MVHVYTQTAALLSARRFRRTPAVVSLDAPNSESMSPEAIRPEPDVRVSSRRHVGPFSFTAGELALILALEEHHPELGTVSERPCIDATWSLERMIAHLASLSPEDVTPFSVGDRTAEVPEKPFEWYEANLLRGWQLGRRSRTVAAAGQF